MTEASERKDYVQKRFIDERYLIGARWWNESRFAPAFQPAFSGGGGDAWNDPRVSRRTALSKLLAFAGVAGVGIAVVAAISKAASRSVASDFGFEPLPDSGPMPDASDTRDLLAVQREHGWATGAQNVRLDFPHAVAADVGGAPFSPDSAAGLAAALSPPSDALKPYYNPTLFQILDGQGGQSLRALLKPIDTPEMRAAYETGVALRTLFQPEDPSFPPPADAAIVIDLPGPESVALAAGLGAAFQPVCVFANWPHPAGVVPSHRTIAAALFHRPQLVGAPATAPAAFVLDRDRLLPYGSDRTKFDNRYVVALPSPEQCAALGIKRLLYVAPGADPLLESDDLNDDFVGFREAGIDVRLVAASDFAPPPTFDVEKTSVAAAETKPAAESRPGEQRRYYGGHATSHFWFWRMYPWWGGSTYPGAVAPTRVSPATSYQPRPRATLFSTGLPGGRVGTKPRPAGFGKVTYRSPSSSGRSGSWTRTSSGSSG